MFPEDSLPNKLSVSLISSSNSTMSFVIESNLCSLRSELLISLSDSIFVCKSRRNPKPQYKFINDLRCWDLISVILEIWGLFISYLVWLLRKFLYEHGKSVLWELETAVFITGHPWILSGGAGTGSVE